MKHKIKIHHHTQNLNHFKIEGKTIMDKSKMIFDLYPSKSEDLFLRVLIDTKLSPRKVSRLNVLEMIIEKIDNTTYSTKKVEKIITTGYLVTKTKGRVRFSMLNQYDLVEDLLMEPVRA